MLVVWAFFFVTAALLVLTTIKIIIYIFSVRFISAEICSVSMNVFPMSMASGKPVYEVVVGYKYELNGKVLNSSDRKRKFNLFEVEKIKEGLRVGDHITVRYILFFPNISYFFDYKYRVWMHVALSVVCGVIFFLTFRSL